MISFIHAMQKRKAYKQQKQKIKPNKKNIQRLITRGEGKVQGEEWVKEVNCIMMGGNSIFGGKHVVMYTEIEI